MASHYEKICEENRRRYGTEGALKSGELAAGLYDDRTHFIFELLQNAEDAIGRRGARQGPRKVTFSLTGTHLTLSHFGKPFDQADVRSVCDIAESTKNESSIGRFGLGFKSVYTVTDLPEIHSGDEDFAIEEYVFPKRADRTAREADETTIILPLRQQDTTASQEITAGLRHLGPGALLFLRHIDEINWSVEGGASGFYVRNSQETLGSNVQRITVIGQETGQAEVDQNWLVFHRDVFSTEQVTVGRVEIAFSLVAAKDTPGKWIVQPLANSPLVVFFPTVVESHLGFLAQGPYRTTPSRDNIPPGDLWNQHLVKESAALLVAAMRWMRDKEMLDVSALRCLPLEHEKFPPGSRFVPMFDAVRQAFKDEALLLTFDGRYVTAGQAKLARTQELRELFSPEQVAALFGSNVATWLSGDITQDKAPEILKYLTQELGIDLITPAKLMPSLTKPFLEAQPDEWVLRLYEFLSGQGAALRRHLDSIPLIRLENGTHVVAYENGDAKAFLPGAMESGFPTVHRAVCATQEARAFLNSLKITEPDPVDDVIRNILPKYRQKRVDVDAGTYAADIERIRIAFNADSTTQKEKLRSALRDTNFVIAVDTGNGKNYIAKPVDVYIATERLKQLFADVPGVLMVDDGYACLRGEDVRDLLVACGSSRYLNPEPITPKLTPSEKVQIRKEAGLERATREFQPEDVTVRGLTPLLQLLPSLPFESRKARAKLLWESLADLEGRGTAAFYGSYQWSFSHETKIARFDAAFIKILNQVGWIPDASGELVPPSLVVFDTLDWKPNFFLLTKIVFKPQIIDQLAKEAGIDPAALDLLRKHGITSVADLASRLGIINQPSPVVPRSVAESKADTQSGSDVYDDAEDLYGDGMPDIPPGTPDPYGGEGVTGGVRRSDQGQGTGSPRKGGQDNSRVPGSSGGNVSHGSQGNGGNGGPGKRSPGHAGGRPFISYVGAHPDAEEVDPDGLVQAVRMQIEARAVDLILRLEPTLCPTSVGNPGFDLYETDGSNKQIRWVEVKAMTGSLNDRPVGMSHTQFYYAKERGDAYWLYIVEHATDPTQARVLRIQNPAAHAKTFTFDRGWSEIAQMEAPSRESRQGETVDG